MLALLLGLWLDHVASALFSFSAKVYEVISWSPFKESRVFVVIVDLRIERYCARPCGIGRGG